MRNLLLDDRTARDIDARIHRIQNDLGYSGGAVILSDVRSLLKLDLHFYSIEKPDFLDQVVHKLRVGAKQVIQRPSLLLEAVRKLDLRALLVPDRKQILIDDSIPDLKKRWAETHEVVHSVLPWHAEYMLGDTNATLLPSCHERIEAEANWGAGRLLFPTQTFSALYHASPVTMQRVLDIAKHFGNTITSTLWRCIEFDSQPAFGVIGQHPHRPRAGEPIVEHFIRSPALIARFSAFDEATASTVIQGYCRNSRAGPLGCSEIVISDIDGNEHIFFSETFCNGYQSLTYARYLRPRSVAVFVPSKR